MPILQAVDLNRSFQDGEWPKKTWATGVSYNPYNRSYNPTMVGAHFV